VYVNDAFGAAHRAHASTGGVARLLPAVAGLLMERELDYLGRIVANPQRPLGAIIGGAKVSDKVGCLRFLLPEMNVLVVGGGMANTFLKAHGASVGESLVEDDQLDNVRSLVDEAKKAGVQLVLPRDVVVGDRFDAGAQAKTVAAHDVPDGWRIMDVGPQSIEAYKQALGGCRTVVWNGTLGVAEFPRFARGSEALARYLAELDAVTVVGGGETAALVRAIGVADKFDHVSTGGGAFLEFLEGRELPGVAALGDA
ncbi:MAG: phosphoglycerate kinase, partial [Dehalococcoidia bacterium]|nr:phosphoglycerate kinase [Dehalococcoidia bacterium]